MPPLIWTKKKPKPQHRIHLISSPSPWRRQLRPRHPPPLLQSAIAMTPRPPLPSLSPPVSLALILSFISSCQVSSRRPRSLYPSFLLSRSGRVINMEGGGPPKPLDPPRLFFIFTIPSFWFLKKNPLCSFSLHHLFLDIRSPRILVFPVIFIFGLCYTQKGPYSANSPSLMPLDAFTLKGSYEEINKTTLTNI